MLLVIEVHGVHKFFIIIEANKEKHWLLILIKV